MSEREKSDMYDDKINLYPDKIILNLSSIQKKKTPKSTTSKYYFYHLVSETAHVVNGEKF